MNNPTQNPKPYHPALQSQELTLFFIRHLNHIYCAKAHLFERLQELADHINFLDLKLPILKTCENVARLSTKIEEIYVLMESKPDLENCDELIAFIEAGFESIHQQSKNQILRDLSVLSYLSLIESIEIASFQQLQMAAVALNNKQIEQLVQDNFDESKAGRLLYSQIAAKYIV